MAWLYGNGRIGVLSDSPAKSKSWAGFSTRTVRPSTETRDRGLKGRSKGVQGNTKAIGLLLRLDVHASGLRRGAERNAAAHVRLS